MYLLAKYAILNFLENMLLVVSMRYVQLKVNIENTVTHAVLELGLSFAALIIAMRIMRKRKWVMNFLCPNKLIKI